MTPKPDGPPNRHHFTTIDALRGFAALSVVLFHLGGASLPKLNSPLTVQLTSWGWTGVEVFFVISGFIIPFVLLKSNFQLRDSGNFLARRAIRIWPPSAILMVLTIAQYAVVYRMQGGVSDAWASPSTPRFLANLFYLVPFTDQTWLNGILWTLAVEFQYYLFLAVVFPLFASRRIWLVAAGIASLFTALLPGADVILFLRFAIFFAMGGLCLLLHERLIGRLMFLAVLAVMSAVATTQFGALPTGFAIAATLIIAFVPIRSRALVFLGTISYSLYLTHTLIASTAEFVVVKIFDPSSAIERLAGQLLCIATAIAGAWIFYLLIERHFVNLSQRVRRRGVKSGPRRAVVVADEGL